ncbi:hypothetical protein [Aureimonas frigidaquae]|uniref:hypothetical protein n=1 Tax=Aureimonas frigidaquae TaxID=424757 RepID=UPI000AAD4416|nr:hypothetical protein [Aureimonas frigidaquae]
MINTEQKPGMTLTGGATADDAVQKFAPTFAATRPEDVFGALPYRGKAEVDLADGCRYPCRREAATRSRLIRTRVA